MPEGKDNFPVPSRDGWALCFILGVVMLNYPFLHIFNKLTIIFGIPLLVLYFLVGWPLSILVIFLFTRFANGHHQPPDQNPKTGQK